VAAAHGRDSQAARGRSSAALLAVLAEHLAQRARDLAERGVCLDGRNDRRQKIVRAARRVADRRDRRVGRASASSRLLQCSDCVPPSTAASACRATRTILLSGCCAVSVLPAVWV
jgi:hypothetical protein